jgi:L-histidine Nalpha-methyltransferase
MDGLAKREPASDFRAAVLVGLSQRQKVVPARFFYDQRGSELFEAITQLPEYYVTRTELQLLERYGTEIASRTGRGRVVVELGAGASTKTPLLLRHVAPAAYVPVDISADFLARSSAELAAAHPGLVVQPLAADFTRPLRLPADLLGQAMLGFFPGSTIGNLGHAAAVDLLRALSETLGEDAQLLIGIDTPKSASQLEAAYDDAAGVTAAFNLNLLTRINRELEGSIPLDAFRHEATWNADAARIEMHLVATRDVAFSVAGRSFALARGETIHTENSHKYTDEEARLLARASGWEPYALWTDDERLFSLHLWRAAPRELSP